MKVRSIYVFCIIIIIISYSMEASEKCHNLDLLFIVDESSSVGLEGFSQIKEFLRQFTNTMGPDNIGQENTRPALVSFGSYAFTEFTFNQIHNNKEFLDALEKLKYHRGLTYTANAFRGALKNMYQSDKGFRENKVPNAIILITDGMFDLEDDGDLTEPATKIKEMYGTNIFSVIVNELDWDASPFNQVTGDEKKVFTVGSFDKITEIIKPLVEKLCQSVQ